MENDGCEGDDDDDAVQAQEGRRILSTSWGGVTSMCP